MNGAATIAMTVEHDEHRHRGTEDRRRGIVVVAFVRVDEQRHERRGEHAAEDQLEHDVGRVVGDVVGVGEHRAAERVRERPTRGRAR